MQRGYFDLYQHQQTVSQLCDGKNKQSHMVNTQKTTTAQQEEKEKKKKKKEKKYALRQQPTCRNELSEMI